MTSKDNLLSVTKLDAARRQLDAALLLYFNDGDPVAVHSLAGATHDLLRDLSAKSGSKMLIEGSLLVGIGPELTEEFRKVMRRPQNFFKHADRDPHSLLQFSPRTTDLLLLDCSAKYLEVTGELTLLQQAFEKWCLLHYPQFWRNTKWKQKAEWLSREARELFHDLGRREFLSKFLSTVTTLQTTGA